MYWIGGIIASMIGFYFGYRRGKEVGYLKGWAEAAAFVIGKLEEKKENGRL